MQAIEYDKSLGIFHDTIMRIPSSDLKYHLYLLLVSLTNINTEYTRAVLDKAQKLSDYLACPLKKDKDEAVLALYFEGLVNTAGINNNKTIIIQGIINICGAVLGFASGLLGSLIGGICGFARGVSKRDSLWEYLWTGLVVGGFLGAAIGFRSPNKLLNNPLFNQIKSALNGLVNTYVRLHARDELKLGYEEKAYSILLKDYFYNNKIELDNYLNTSEVSYEIATFGAEFISQKLAGSIGHHFFIKIPIKDKFFGIELSLSPSDYIKTPVQLEKRVVTGRKVLEMIGLHLSLEKIDYLSPRYIAFKLKFGEIDCMSYINKILIGTSQESTYLSRYHESDNRAGKVVRFLVERISIYSK